MVFLLSNHYILPLFLIYISLYLPTTHCKYIQFNITNSKEISWNINELQKTTFQIDIDSTFSCVKVPLESEHLIPINTKEKIYTLNNSFFLDTNHKNVPFTLYFKYKDSSQYIALSPIPNHPEFSVIEQMYKQQLISSKKFAIQLNDNFMNQYLYFGDLPNTIKTNYPSIVTIPVLPYNSTDLTMMYWSFQIKYFKSANSNLQLTKKIKLSLIHDIFVADKNIFNWVKDDLLKKYFINKQCWIKETSWVHIQCNSEVYNELPSFSLVVSEHPLKTIEIKLRKSVQNDEVNLAYNRVIDDYDYVFINQNIFFDRVIEFDYDGQMLTFYSKSHLQENENGFMIKSLFLFTACLLCGCLVYLMVVNKCLGSNLFKNGYSI